MKISGGVFTGVAVSLTSFLAGALATALYMQHKSKEKRHICSYCKVDKNAEVMERKSRESDAELRKIVHEMNHLKEGSVKRSLKRRALEKLREKKMYDKIAADLRRHSVRMLQAKQTAEIMDRNNIHDVQTEIANAVALAERIQNITGDLSENQEEIEVDESELEAELAALNEGKI